jgi:hypothetical protein
MTAGCESSQFSFCYFVPNAVTCALWRIFWHVISLLACTNFTLCADQITFPETMFEFSLLHVKINFSLPFRRVALFCDFLQTGGFFRKAFKKGEGNWFDLNLVQHRRRSRRYASDLCANELDTTLQLWFVNSECSTKVNSPKQFSMARTRGAPKKNRCDSNVNSKTQPNSCIGERACSIVVTRAQVVPQVLGSTPCGNRFIRI